MCRIPNSQCHISHYCVTFPYLTVPAHPSVNQSSFILFLSCYALSALRSVSVNYISGSDNHCHANSAVHHSLPGASKGTLVVIMQMLLCFSENKRKDEPNTISDCASAVVVMQFVGLLECTDSPLYPVMQCCPPLDSGRYRRDHRESAVGTCSSLTRVESLFVRCVLLRYFLHDWYVAGVSSCFYA